jgi:hypothetical protein
MTGTWRSRPPWPPQMLIDLAALREPTEQGLSPELLDIAFDHRMGGLLWTWAQNRDLDEHLKRRLAMHDLRVQAHQERLRTTLERTIHVLGEAGIDVASVKGLTTQQRWYRRPGERPMSDIDLWLSPHQLDRAGDALRLLQPDHPWNGFFGDLTITKQVQNVTTRVDGVEVDLHVDLLKTGLWMRGADRVWAATLEAELPGCGSVRVLDETAALLHFIVHLTKDRFQRLLGYADVVRIIDAGVDWPRFLAMADVEGLRPTALCALETVMDDLGLPWPTELPSPSPLFRAMWQRIWSSRVRLRGSVGRQQHRRRQLAIIPLAQRDPAEQGRALADRLLPPAEILGAANGQPALRVALSRAVRHRAIRPQIG